MALDPHYRRTMYETFTELQGNWVRLGVDYPTTLRRYDGLRGTYYVATADENGYEVAVLPGLDNLSSSPITANTILAAAVQATRMVLMSPEHVVVPLPPHLRLVRDDSRD
jgi:hypothetical protein